jgi:hypothetical protein
MQTAFRIQQGVYYLLLGMWLGAMVMLVLAATASFAFVREHTLIVGVQGYGEPLKGDTATGFIAGGIVGVALTRLVVLQAVCATALAACVLLQCTRFRAHLDGPVWSKRNRARMFLLLVPTGVLLFNVLVVSPGIDRHRDAKYDPATPPQVAEQADEAFDRYHRLSTRTFGVSTLMLAGAMVLSPWCFKQTAVTPGL